MRRLKMTSKKVRFEVPQLGKAFHNLSKTLEYPKREKVFFGVRY